MLLWLARHFIGKKTYTTLALLLLKWVAQSQGIEVADEQLSSAIDVGLVFVAGLMRHVGKVAEQERAAGKVPTHYQGGNE